MKQTAVEWLYEKLEYVNWMRNRDEISSGMADEWRKHYLEQAKAMEKEQKIQFATEYSNHILNHGLLTPTEFFKQNFKSK